MKLFFKILAYPLLLVSIILAVLLIVSAYCPMLPPVGKWPLLSLSGLAFPYLMLANVALLVFWLVTWKKGALVPLAAILATAIPFYHYCPVHFPDKNIEGDLTIASYNTEGFGLNQCKDRSETNPVLQHILGFDAQIVCLQEASSDVMKSIREGSSTDKAFPYRYFDATSGQGCLSVYPILEHEIIDFGTAKGNKCLFMKILAGQDTIAVFNCHLQSNALVQKDFDDNRQNMGLDPSMRVVKKLLKATSLRASQAELVSSKAREYRKALVVGDFNDSPLSYTHHKFDHFMDDCFARSGNGPGFTYHGHSLHYRIDHIFCTDAFQPVRCRVDRKCQLSDHYPIIAVLKHGGK